MRADRVRRIDSVRAATTLLFALSLVQASVGVAATAVADAPGLAQAVDGQYISWREHLIDDSAISGIELSGSDGFVLGDVDGDGWEDIVSVHESDSSYDGNPDGDVRIAFGSADPHQWTNITLAEGRDAAAPEDAALADVNGDGHLDVVVASELSHLLYLQNPGTGVRTASWPRLVLPMTRDRGSYIRVFLADLDGDGRVEVLAPNKGAQNPTRADFERLTPVSLFRHSGPPLEAQSWTEQIIGNYSVPQNAQPVDLDGDGDLDILVGSRGEQRLILFENVSVDSAQPGEILLREHRMEVTGARPGGFNLDFADINGDGRLDVLSASGLDLFWLEQPSRWDEEWTAHRIGSFAPDSMTGFGIADINGDGRVDVLAGSYSRGPREQDGDVTVNDALGRIGWFEQPQDLKQDWPRHDISRRKRGMFDKFIARDLDRDGDMDFIGTRGNSAPYDGVFWLEQVRSAQPIPVFRRARSRDSEEVPLP